MIDRAILTFREFESQIEIVESHLELAEPFEALDRIEDAYKALSIEASRLAGLLDEAGIDWA